MFEKNYRIYFFPKGTYSFSWKSNFTIIYLVNFCFPVCIINKRDSAIVSQQITTGKQICLTLGGLLKKLGNYRCHQFSKGPRLDDQYLLKICCTKYTSFSFRVR